MDEVLCERDEVHRLIVEAASGARRLTSDQLGRILRWVAAVGFDPNARETVRGFLAGLPWQGQLLSGRNRLPPAERHFLRHVVKLQEWPSGASLDDYVASISDVILDDASGVYTGTYEGILQLGVMRRSGDLRGPNGGHWVLVEYRLAIGHWTTAYQPTLGLLDLSSRQRGSLRWLRRARLRRR